MHRVLVLIALAALFAVTKPPQPPSGAVDLLQMYEPVLLFHPSEDWAPEPVETFLKDARVEKQVAQGSWKTIGGPLPTSNAGCA